jgi:hypothetical protein
MHTERLNPCYSYTTIGFYHSSRMINKQTNKQTNKQVEVEISEKEIVAAINCLKV